MRALIPLLLLLAACGGNAPGFEALEKELLGKSESVEAEPFYVEGDPKPEATTRISAHEDGVTRLAFLPDGLLASISYGDYYIRIWDPETGDQIAEEKSDERPSDLAVLPDGSALLVVDVGGNLTRWPLTENGFGDPLVHNPGGRQAPKNLGSSPRVAVSPNGKLAATASFDKIVTLWDLTNGEEIRRIRTPDSMRDLAFSPDGKRLAAGSTTNKFSVWDLSSGRGDTYTVSKANATSDVFTVAFSPDGKRLATGHMDSSLSIWEGSKEVHNWFVANSSIHMVAFSPDGSLFCAAAQNKSAPLFQNGDGRKLLASLTGHKAPVLCLAFRADGRMLATGGGDGSIFIWQ